MKKLLIIVGSALAILVAVAMLVPYVISGDTFKAQIEQRFAQATGHELSIGGHVRIRVFPFVGATLEEVTVGGFKEPGAPPLIKLKSLNVDVALLPLLSKNVQVKSLLLKEPQISLQVNAQGADNWQFGSADAKEKPAANAAGSSMPSNLLLQNISVSDGSVTYSNAQTKDNWKLEKVGLDASLEGFASALHVKGGATWNGKPVKAEIETGALSAGPAGKLTANISSDLFSLKADGDIANKIYSGKISVKSPSLKALMGWLTPGGKPLATASTLAFDMDGISKCSTTFCDITKATINLDKLSAKGEIKTTWDNPIPHVEVNLSADQLDLNPFLPPEQHAASGLFIHDAAAEAWSNAPIDFSVLRQVDFLAHINTGSLLIRKITIGKTALTAKIQKGVLTADILDADFYQGKANIALHIDASSNDPIFEKRVTMHGVQMSPLLKDATDSDRLSGTAELQSNTSSHGNSMQELIANSSGNGQIKITDGAIKGFNLADMARFLTSKISTVGNIVSNPTSILTEFRSAFSNDSAKKTDFAEMGSTYTIVNGVLNNNDLALKAPFVRTTGSGQINLVQSTIDYHLKVQLVETSQGQNGKDKNSLIDLPFVMKGNLADAKPEPDIGLLVQSLLSGALHSPETIIKTIGDSPKDATNTFKGLLKGFKKPQ